MALTVSTLTLTAIALERLLAVKNPLAVRRMERKNMRIIVVIWLGAVLVSLPFLIYRQLATVHVSAIIHGTHPFSFFFFFFFFFFFCFCSTTLLGYVKNHLTASFFPHPLIPP
jgi:hypothetical protein